LYLPLVFACYLLAFRKFWEFFGVNKKEVMAICPGMAKKIKQKILFKNLAHSNKPHQSHFYSSFSGWRLS